MICDRCGASVATHLTLKLGEPGKYTCRACDAELVLDDLKQYLEGGHSPIRHEILDALLRFAKARGVTLPSAPEKCSIRGCTKDAVHRQEIGSGDVFLLCEEHHQAIFRATLCNAGGVERFLHVDFGIGDRSSSIRKTYGPLEEP